MKKKQVVVLGAGISGLASAWYLSKKNQDYDLILLEKEQVPGGCIRTDFFQEQVIERGPRIFKGSKNTDFLEFIHEIGFSEEIITSSEKAKARYICLEGKLQKVFSANWRFLLLALLQEWKKPCEQEDESIWNFACRRFGVKIAEQVFDPLAIGIYAGDIRKLSIQSCFPVLKKWEREKKSVTLGALSALFSRKKSSLPFFSFQKGGGSFIEKLVKQAPFSIEYGKNVREIIKEADKIRVVCDDRTYEADHVVVALNAKAAADLFCKPFPDLSLHLNKIAYESLTSVYVSWDKPVLSFPGLGYLVPSQEKEDILGVLFDSNLFPFQSSFSGTKMTVMLKGEPSQEEIVCLVNRACTRHLHIDTAPNCLSSKGYKYGIPQYFVGHDKLVQAINEKTPSQVTLVGNYLEGVSVNDCVALARKKMESLVI